MIKGAKIAMNRMRYFLHYKDHVLWLATTYRFV